jgi:hypothetical protein
MMGRMPLKGTPMTRLHDQIARLCRPRLLIRAARFGLDGYRRPPALRALLAGVDAGCAEHIVTELLEREAQAEAQRNAGDAGYSVARHVELLIALMAESRLLPPAAEEPRDGTKAGNAPAFSAGAEPAQPPAEPDAADASAAHVPHRHGSCDRSGRTWHA